ncbi:MAG: transcription antitermination factor NusB [Planctomycetales bacterium]|nr:transcription antitermination factor NusB [Planctomycetales bacterium]
MPRRSRAREVVLQVLYQDDLNPTHSLNATDEFLRARLHNHAELIEFANSILSGTRRNRPELDQILESRASNWSLERMAATDRNILRLGAFEILYTETPGRVAINEAVELAKRYGSKQSAQFVNGILDGLLPDKNQPDKNQPTTES